MPLYLPEPLRLISAGGYFSHLAHVQCEGCGWRSFLVYDPHSDAGRSDIRRAAYTHQCGGDAS